MLRWLLPATSRLTHVGTGLQSYPWCRSGGSIPMTQSCRNISRSGWRAQPVSGSELFQPWNKPFILIYLSHGLRAVLILMGKGNPIWPHREVPYLSSNNSCVFCLAHCHNSLQLLSKKQQVQPSTTANQWIGNFAAEEFDFRTFQPSS